MLSGANDLIIAEWAIPMLVGDRLPGVFNIESEQTIDEEDAGRRLMI